MKSNYLKNRCGFTLVETMVTMLIMVILMTAVVAYMRDIQILYYDGEAMNSLKNYTRIVGNVLTDKIRAASTAKECNDTTPCYTGATIGDRGITITLIDSTGILTQTISYYLTRDGISGDPTHRMLNIIIDDTVGTERALTNFRVVLPGGVNNIFSSVDTDWEEVRVYFTLIEKNMFTNDYANGPHLASFESTVFRRN